MRPHKSQSCWTKKIPQRHRNDTRGSDLEDQSINRSGNQPGERREPAADLAGQGAPRLPGVAESERGEVDSGNQADPKRLKAIFDELDQKAIEIAATLKIADDFETAQRLRMALSLAIGAAFDARQRLHAAEVTVLRERLQVLEDGIKLRRELKNKIVQRRLDDLLQQSEEREQASRPQSADPFEASRQSVDPFGEDPFNNKQSTSDPFESDDNSVREPNQTSDDPFGGNPFGNQ